MLTEALLVLVVIVVILVFVFSRRPPVEPRGLSGRIMDCDAACEMVEAIEIAGSLEDCEGCSSVHCKSMGGNIYESCDFSCDQMFDIIIADIGDVNMLEFVIGSAQYGCLTTTACTINKFVGATLFFWPSPTVAVTGDVLLSGSTTVNWYFPSLNNISEAVSVNGFALQHGSTSNNVKLQEWKTDSSPSSFLWNYMYFRGNVKYPFRAYYLGGSGKDRYLYVNNGTKLYDSNSNDENTRWFIRGVHGITGLHYMSFTWTVRPKIETCITTIACRHSITMKISFQAWLLFSTPQIVDNTANEINKPHHLFLNMLSLTSRQLGTLPWRNGTDTDNVNDAIQPWDLILEITKPFNGTPSYGLYVSQNHIGVDYHIPNVGVTVGAPIILEPNAPSRLSFIDRSAGGRLDSAAANLSIIILKTATGQFIGTYNDYPDHLSWVPLHHGSEFYDYLNVLTITKPVIISTAFSS